MRRDTLRIAHLGLALALLMSGTGQGQPVPRPSPVDLSALATELADQVRYLSQDIQTQLAGTREGPHLAQEAGELSNAVGQFRALIDRRPDLPTLQRNFLPIDGAWNHLKISLARMGTPPTIDRGVQRVDQIEAQVRQALGLSTPSNLLDLAHNLARQVLHLSEDMQLDLGQTTQGGHLIQDTQEVAQSVLDFTTLVQREAPSFELNRAFAAIESAWNHVTTELRRLGSTPAVDRSARRVEQAVVEVRQALGLNNPPVIVDPSQPGNIAEAQRLALAMHQRAEALSAAMQGNLGGNPNAFHVLNDASQLVQSTDGFYDLLGRPPLASPDRLAAAYRPIRRVSECLQGDFGRNPPPPAVNVAWQSFLQAQALTHQALGLPAPPPPPPIQIVPPPGRPSPLVDLSNALVENVAAFVQVFAPNAGRVPQGNLMLVDARRLLDRATDFQRDVARGTDPARLARRFREVDEHYQRLARRVDRIAQGRTGPNIQQVQRIGAIVGQIDQALGLGGYGPLVPVPYGPFGRDD